MAQKKLEKLRKSSLETLYKELNDVNMELMKLTSMVKSGGAPENPARIRFLKKRRARLLTIIREKELGKIEARPT